MKYLKFLKFTVPVFVIFIFAFVQWSGLEPKIKSVDQMIEDQGVKDHANIVGDATTSAYIYVLETMLTKNGGYLSNDLLVKMKLFDNMPRFEFGAIEMTRDLALVMRDSFSKSSSSSTANKSLSDMHPFVNFPNDAWNPMASTESSYEKSISRAKDYLSSLQDHSDKNAQFYARANNLVRYLERVEQKLGSLSQRLSASTGQSRENTDLANDSSAEKSKYTSSEVFVKTPWLKVDDVFWESRGTTWALIHYLKAVQVDFDAVLVKKNAKATIEQIIRELEMTQESLWSPIILNGSGFGLVANHSLTMANYISRANSQIINLKDLLNNG